MVNERNRDVTKTRRSDRAKPQLIQMIVEALYANCPRDERRPLNSKKHHPCTRLKYAIWRSVHPEWILFGVARHKGAIGASPDCAVENENRCSVLLSLNYIPSLSDFGYLVTSVGKRNRGLNLAEIVEAPKTRDTRTDVFKTPSGGKSAHRSCAKHEEDGDNTKEQRPHGDRRKPVV